MALVVLALLAGTVAFAQKNSQKSLESQRAKLQKDIELINRKLAENSRSSEKVLSNLTLVRSKIAKREQLIDECDRTLKVLGDSVALCEKEIAVLQDRYDTLSVYYAKLVRNAYKNRDSKTWYMYILSSQSVGQAFRRVGYFRSLSSQMNVQAQKIHEASAALEAKKDRLLSLTAQADVYESTMILVNKQNRLPSDYVPSDLSRPDVHADPAQHLYLAEILMQIHRADDRFSHWPSASFPCGARPRRGPW